MMMSPHVRGTHLNSLDVNKILRGGGGGGGTHFTFHVGSLISYISISCFHDDVIKWKHVPRHWLLCGELTGDCGEFNRRATIVSAENQNGATIVKATFFFCHYYIVWESNNAGEARGHSWNESLKSRWIPGGSCGYTSGTKRKHFDALSSPRPCWRWLQLQPSFGSPRWSVPQQQSAL